MALRQPTSYSAAMDRETEIAPDRILPIVAGATVLVLGVLTAGYLSGTSIPLLILLASFAGGILGWMTARAQVHTTENRSLVPPMRADAVDHSTLNLLSKLELPGILLDESQRVLAHNRAARDLFPAIADGQPLALVSRNPELHQAIEHARQTGHSASAEMTERLPFDRRLVVSAAPITSMGPILLQFRDTSEAARLAQLRSDFIANASHELRTPLASIRGFIETLQGPARADEAARQRFLGIMDVQAQRMNRILDDLLSLSRIEMRAHLHPETVVEVRDIVSETVRGLDPLARSENATITLEMTDQPCRVHGERDELSQVVQNLVHNAIKYGRHGGKVEVCVRRGLSPLTRRDSVEIAVRDDGPGIAREHLPRLTERFYRVDAARSREKGGTGLGLAIVKHILNRHRGELEIESEIGRGSTFTVVLAAVREDDAA